MAKGFEARVFEFRVIVTSDRSYGISVPLIPQPQDKISNKTKCIPLFFQIEDPCIPVGTVFWKNRSRRIRRSSQWKAEYDQLIEGRGERSTRIKRAQP
jgi:hypothetical protein